MNTASRKALLVVSVAAAMALIAASYTHTVLSLVYPAAMGGFGVLAVAYFTHPGRRYVAPALWSLFYVLGYVLSCAAAIMTIDDDHGRSTFGNAARYLSDESCAVLVSVIASGLAAMFLATRLLEAAAKDRVRQRGEDRLIVIPPRRRQALGSLLGVWWVASCVIIGLMWFLGIGRTGLHHSTVLPMKVSGMLVYVKNIVIPLFGFVAYQCVLRREREIEIGWALARIAFVAVLGSLAFLSRGFFVATIGPCLLYTFCYGPKKQRRSPAARALALSALALVLVLIPAIQFFRDLVYTGHATGRGALVEVTRLEVSATDMARGLITLATTRVLGFNELAAVIRRDLFDPAAPFRVFAGDEEYNRQLMSSLFGFSGNPSGDTAFGYGYGIWGMFYLSGSLLAVFVGTFLFSCCAIAAEEVFRRTGLPATRVCVAFLIGLWLWGGIDWFLLWRLFFSVGCCYLAVRSVFGLGVKPGAWRQATLRGTPGGAWESIPAG